MEKVWFWGIYIEKTINIFTLGVIASCDITTPVPWWLGLRCPHFVWRTWWWTWRRFCQEPLEVSWFYLSFLPQLVWLTGAYIVGNGGMIHNHYQSSHFPIPKGRTSKSNKSNVRHWTPASRQIFGSATVRLIRGWPLHNAVDGVLPFGSPAKCREVEKTPKQGVS